MIKNQIDYKKYVVRLGIPLLRASLNEFEENKRSI